MGWQSPRISSVSRSAIPSLRRVDLAVLPAATRFRLTEGARPAYGEFPRHFAKRSTPRESTTTFT